MTPLEKAKAAEGRVNYCDECKQFEIVGNACYCKVDGKLIHPIMLARGQGTGPAWNCKKRKKPETNYDRLICKTPEEMAEFFFKDPARLYMKTPKETLDWLKQEVEDNGTAQV